jgi:DNA polymerase delta subunit 2
MHPDDHLILEDESGRVTLAGAIPPAAAFVTGKSGTSTES